MEISLSLFRIVKLSLFRIVKFK